MTTSAPVFFYLLAPVLTERCRLIRIAGPHIWNRSSLSSPGRFRHLPGYSYTTISSLLLIRPAIWENELNQLV
jgi:hypothetical protein